LDQKEMNFFVIQHMLVYQCMSHAKAMFFVTLIWNILSHTKYIAVCNTALSGLLAILFLLLTMNRCQCTVLQIRGL